MQVPARTGKYCPACGAEMDAAPPMRAAARAAPADAPAADGFRPFEGSPSDPMRRPLEPEPYDLEQPQVAVPVALAAGGALLGALLWAGIAYATGMEIGYVAWAIGGLVGGGMVLGGGRGVGHAGIAAALALVGIFGGKVYGTHLLVEHELEKLEAAMFTREGFEQMRAMARQMAEQPAAPAGEVLAAMEADGYEHEMTEAEMQELQQGLAEQAARFARMLESDYTYEAWRAEMVAGLREQVSAWELMKENLDFLDVLFVLLGLTTAFGVVQRAAAGGAPAV